ncbi:hypothetical protein ES705_38461 [subsurface metagenome]
MIKKLTKFYQAIADFILSNLNGCKVRWGEPKSKKWWEVKK